MNTKLIIIGLMVIGATSINSFAASSSSETVFEHNDLASVLVTKLIAEETPSCESNIFEITAPLLAPHIYKKITKTLSSLNSLWHNQLTPHFIIKRMKDAGYTINIALFISEKAPTAVIKAAIESFNPEDRANAIMNSQALCRAYYNDDQETIKLLLSHLSSTEQVIAINNAEEESIIYKAVYQGKPLTFVQTLLGNVPNADRIAMINRTYYGRTVLEEAEMRGFPNIAQLFQGYLAEAAVAGI